jgi:hypothetical protein
MKTLKPDVQPAKHVAGAEMQKYLDVFEALKVEHAAKFASQHGLTIKTGFGLDAVLFKLLKATWTTDGPDALVNTNGLFFSVWVDAECEAKGIARYNLHAKKLRAIKGETFAAREFVRAFRAQSGEDLKGWPNVSYPKGPITLFEGSFKLYPHTLQNETLNLAKRFAELTPLLEKLLQES